MLSKLRSRKGASLIVALLLLIVCSTVGSIILTAATANVGRMSERSEYDQKYYRVISAARLFADELSKQEQVKVRLNRKFVPIGEEEEEDELEEVLSLLPLPMEDTADMSAAALYEILQRAVYGIYAGGAEEEIPADMPAEQYWGLIGTTAGEANYKESSPVDFTVKVGEGEDGVLTAAVYARFIMEADRMTGGINQGLGSVTHTITSVFYSDKADTGEDGSLMIPEDAYVVQLVCPFYPELSMEADEDGTETVTLTFRWKRDDAQITQVRGVA